MSDAAVHGKSYGEIVLSAFRKNRTARAALWVSVVMLIISALTPLLANDRPFFFRGAMPGEYQKSFNQVTKGAFFNILGLPGRLKEESGKLASRSATESEFLKRVTEEEARRIYPAFSRLHKHYESLPEQRGRWASHDVSVAEMLAEMTAQEKGPFEAAIQRVMTDLPSTYQGLLQDALAGFDLKLRELADQLDAPLAAQAAAIAGRFRSAVGEGYLTATEDRRPAMRAVLDDLKITLDPKKASLREKTRYPLLDSLNGLDVFFILLTLAGLVGFGPLSWGRLKRIVPLERRWGITWLLILAPSFILAVAWEIAHDVKFQSVSYKKGVQEGSILISSSLWPPLRYRYDEVPEVKPGIQYPSPPDREHVFGTDFMGRDLFSRMLWGSRISLSIGFVSTAIAVAIGIILGALAGFYRGIVDMILSRIIEIMLCFPSFFVILAVIAFLPPSIFNVMIVLGLFGWMGIARLQRSEFLRLMGQDFVVAARALGATDARNIFRHILPNGLGPVLVSASFGIAGAMLTESGLSYLGFGVQEPATSWGQILYTGRSQLDKWWTFTIPGAAIFLAVTCYNLVGDGIRDAVDPRLKT